MTEKINKDCKSALWLLLAHSTVCQIIIADQYNYADLVFDIKLTRMFSLLLSYSLTLKAKMAKSLRCAETTHHSMAALHLKYYMI